MLPPPVDISIPLETLPTEILPPPVLISALPPMDPIVILPPPVDTSKFFSS